MRSDILSDDFVVGLVRRTRWVLQLREDQREDFGDLTLTVLLHLLSFLPRRRVLAVTRLHVPHQDLSIRRTT